MSSEQIKPGYKRTEVGVIPEDWEVRTLQQLCREQIAYGIVQCGPHVPNGVPYVRVSDMDTRELQPDGMLRTTKEIADRFTRSRVETGDLIFALRGKLGEIRRVPESVNGANLTQGTARLAPNNAINSEYFLWGLQDEGFTRRLDLSAKGSTFREITLDDLRRQQLCVPSLGEQLAIATALSDVDALLAQLDQQIAKKRDLKQAAMQQLLTGQTRLPGFSGEWEVHRLGEIAEVAKGEQLHSDETSAESEIPHYNGGVSPSGFTYKANALANSIAISEGGNSCGFVQFIDQPFWCGGHCYLVVPKNIDKRFLYQALKGRQKSIMELRVGSGLPNVQKTALLAFSFDSPMQRDEQTAIATVLSDMDAELAVLAARRDKTSALKQGMMQELLTGRIRLV